MKIRLCEHFMSIQGEGIFCGQVQYFIRLSGCNLKCAYCDTEHEKDVQEIDAESLVSMIPEEAETISVTGGEPLLQADALVLFLQEMKKKKKKIFLETNGTLPRQFISVRDYTDIVSMDLKPECKMTDFQLQFADLASVCMLYFKIVISFRDDLEMVVRYIKRFSDFSKCRLVLQPEFSDNRKNLDSCLFVYNKIRTVFHDVRIIPQWHKLVSLK